MWWQTSRFRLDLSRPLVMGIVNATPDSFADAFHLADLRSQLERCEALLREGADLLDIGGESTRPGADLVSEPEELTRVLPILREAVKLGVPISVDTCKTAVMRAALDLGTDIINDVSGLAVHGAADVLRAYPNAGLCLVHPRRPPSVAKVADENAVTVPTVVHELGRHLDALVEGGLDSERIVLDPGIGFGKSVALNFALLGRQAELLVLGRPLLIGWSRKGSLGAVTGRAAHDRLGASVAAALLAAQQGASVLRVHDVAATVDALKVWQHAQMASA